MNERSDPPPARSRALVALAVLAPALGGSTELWARGALLTATAAVLVIWPPRRSPGKAWLAIWSALLTLAAATAFLPARWFPTPPWRQLLTGTFEVPLPPTLSPQPWLSAEAAGLFFAALAYAAALAAHGWRSASRREAARIYALGILALTALAIGSLVSKWHVPWWPQPANSGIGFGFFPNRNQTANVVALAGIMMAALAWESLNRQQRRGYFWFAGLALAGVGLVISYSRAGIVLFIGGAVAWVLLSLRFSASKKGATLGFAAVLVLLAGFFLFGGETLKRFERQTAPPGRDYRLEIQHDAWLLAAQRPWLGQSLASFEPVFAVTQRPSFRQDRALHPESDWLWAAVEMGWPAVALMAGALGLWAWRTLPFESGSDRYLRSAAAVCGVAFAAHGLVDVSGHRAGSLWPALFLFSIALHPRVTGGERPWVAPLFRACGVVTGCFGVWWLISAMWPARTLPAPTSGTLAFLERQADDANQAANPPAALAAADAGLRISPLQWRLYYQRALARAATPGRLQAAASDFDTARFLEPRWVDLCLGEGRIWLAVDEPQLALDAFIEALRRAGDRAPEFFDQMLAMSRKKFEVRMGLARIAERHPPFLVIWLEQSGGLDFQLPVERLLERDPELNTLNGPQRKRLFTAWYRAGDRGRLIELLIAHPEWQEDAWPWIARYYASRGDQERAWHFVQRYATPPTLPHLNSAQSLAELERGFHFHPDDFQKGLELYSALRKLRQTDEALATLRAVESIPGSPRYLPWLEAELWAEKREWARAWAAYERFRDATGG